MKDEYRKERPPSFPLLFLHSSVTGEILLRKPLCLSLLLHLIPAIGSLLAILSSRYFADIKHISHIYVNVNRTHGTSAVFLILIRRDSAVESFYSCIIAQSIANRPSVKVSSDQEHSQNDDQGGLCPSGRIR